MLVGLENRSLEVRLVGRHNRGHLLDIFSSLFFHDIYYVVDRDDTNHPLFAVNNGHGRKVVLLQHLGRFFLVVRRFNADDILIHEITDNLFLFVDQKIPERHGSDQHSFLVKHIQNVDCFRIDPDIPDSVNRVCDGHVFPKIHKLDRHDRAG